jgi:hypothetical protein
MEDVPSVQLSRLIELSKSRDYLEEVRRIFLFHYPADSFEPVEWTFHLVENLFEGRFPGYKGCNTEYHDHTHTMDAFLASARLLDGYNLQARPMIDVTVAVDLLLAALFHDTGYIQEEWDEAGTGAKHTKSHVDRSVNFVARNFHRFHIPQDDVAVISRIIQCTGLNVDVARIRFPSEQVRIAGAFLGTSDLLGQMSDRAYLEKLLFLYNEFKEAGVPGYETEFDILKNTLGFYKLTLKKLDGELMRAYEYARRHFSDRFDVDRNLYIEAIRRHMEYLENILKDDTTNFRKKLKRIPLEDKEKSLKGKSKQAV